MMKYWRQISYKEKRFIYLMILEVPVLDWNSGPLMRVSDGSGGDYVSKQRYRTSQARKQKD
jgi:hypothetical protein